MTLESPHLPSAVPATHVSISELIPRLVGAQDPSAIVSGGDEQTYAQVIWREGGFSFDYQAGSVAEHYRTVRDDLTVAETIATLNNYAAGAPIWSLGLEFSRTGLRAGADRVGGLVDRVLGSLRRLFR